MAQGQEPDAIGAADDVEILGVGTRYAWGRSGESFTIWIQRGHAVAGTFRGPRARTNAWVEFQALETRARKERKRRRWQWSVVAGIVAVIVAGTAAVVITRDRAGTDQAAPLAPVPAAGTLQRFEDDSARFTFRYPSTWVVTSDAAATEIASPGDMVSFTVEPAPSGDPAEIAATVTSDRTAGWTSVELEGTQHRLVGDLPAVSIGGLGTDPQGARMRFVSIVLAGSDGNYAITVQVRADADPATTTPGIEDILSSFRLVTS